MDSPLSRRFAFFADALKWPLPLFSSMAACGFLSQGPLAGLFFPEFAVPSCLSRGDGEEEP
jgi:hypothetical protein